MSYSKILKFWYKQSYSNEVFAKLVGLKPPKESRTNENGWAEFKEGKNWACSIIRGRRVLIVHSARVSLLKKLKEAGFKEIRRKNRV